MGTWFWGGQVQIGTNGQQILQGSGSPQGSITAPVGSMYLRSDGGANSSVYIKESGSGNTGWSALGSAFASPMTSRGDMIYGGTGGVPTRVPFGSPGMVPTIQIDGSVAFQNPTGSVGPPGPTGPAAYLGSFSQNDGYTIQQPGDLGTLQISDGPTDTFNIGTVTTDFYCWVFAADGDLTLNSTDPNGFLPSNNSTYVVKAGTSVLLLADNSTFWGGGWWVLQYHIPPAGSTVTAEITQLTNLNSTGTTNVLVTDHKKVYFISGRAIATLQMPAISSVSGTHPDFRFWVAINSSSGGAALLLRNSSDQFTNNIPGPIGGTGSTKPYPVNGFCQVAITGFGQWAVTNTNVNDWISVNTQTGSSYTADFTDMNGLIRMNNAGANTVTIPAESTAYFPPGVTISVRQVGAGQTTIAGAGGVTINTPSTLNLRVQQSTVQLVKTQTTNTWDLMGDVA